MKTTDKQLNPESVLRSCLKQVPFLKLTSIKHEPPGPDLVAKLSMPDGKKTLVVETRQNGQPRLARDAVNQLVRYVQALPNSYGVFMAPYISPRAAEICEREGVGYVDLAGNCLLTFGQVYIRQDGRPNPFAKRRDLRSLFSPKATRVLRVLLANPSRMRLTMFIAMEVQVSLGQVANVKKLLADREWIDVETAGFNLKEPEKLLQEWSENYTFRNNQARDFYTPRSIPEMESSLAEACGKQEVRYALTGFSGAARFAPAVRYQRAMAFVESGIDQIAERLDLKEVPSGANVTLLEPYDQGVFYDTKDVDGVKVASPIQVYLDLIGFRGRGEEAAAALLEEVIKPSW